MRIRTEITGDHPASEVRRAAVNERLRRRHGTIPWGDNFPSPNAQPIDADCDDGTQVARGTALVFKSEEMHATGGRF